MKRSFLEQIGKTCHDVHLAYSKEINVPTQPEWNQLSENHKKIIMDSVQKIYDDTITSPEMSHENFVFMKNQDGWVYSDEYSKENKTNPRLVPFSELSLEDRLKEILFFTIVNSFKS